MKTWRTILENKTDQANKKIQHFLHADADTQAPKKGLAIFFAVLGLSLLVAGISPFVLDGKKSASIIIGEEAPDGESVVLDEGEVLVGEGDVLDFNNEAEEVQIDFSATETTKSEPTHQVADEFIAQPVDSGSQGTTTNTNNNASDFRINSHIGTEDKTGITTPSLINQPVLASNNSVNSSKNTKTGPASTALFLIAPILAVFFRKKSLAISS